MKIQTHQFLGIVEEGNFRSVWPTNTLGTYHRLTSMGRQVAQSPESAELDLTQYEGQAIMVQGQDEGVWIWSAEIIDVAGPILTAVVRQICGVTPQTLELASTQA